MKTYGAMKATEFTKKQINVLFAKAKKGELKIEKWYIGELYNLAEYYGYDDNGSVAEHESLIKDILEFVFAGEIEKAQTKITEHTNDWFERMSFKTQERTSRELMA